MKNTYKEDKTSARYVLIDGKLVRMFIASSGCRVVYKQQ